MIEYLKTMAFVVVVGWAFLATFHYILFLFLTGSPTEAARCWRDFFFERH